MGAVIAHRKLTLSRARTVTVTIGKPKKFRGGNDYYCPYRITGIGQEQIGYAGGVDPVQALQHTLMKIGTDLYTSKEAKTGRLRWDAGSTKGDLGFPVPNAIRDLVPGTSTLGQ